MAITYNTSTNLATGTGTRSWSHTAAASLVGGAGVVITDGAVEETSGVTYGGGTMTRIATGANIAGESGTTSCWWIANDDAGWPGNGTQTVEITRSGSTAYIATCYTVLTASGASADVLEGGQNVGWDIGSSLSISTITTSLTIPSGKAVFLFGGLYSGENALSSITDNASLTRSHSQDFGNFVGVINRRTAIYTGTGSALTTFAWTQSNDDGAWAVVAISENMSVTVVPGSFTANAFIPGYFRANAAIEGFGDYSDTWSNLWGTPAVTGDFKADAVIAATRTGSFTAAAVIKKTQSRVTYIHDAPSRVVASGWGISDSGTDWSGDDAEMSVDGVDLVNSMSVADTDQPVLTTPAVADAEALVRVKTDKLAEGDYLQAVIHLRDADTSTYIRANANFLTNQEVRVEISKSTTGGTSTLVGPTTVGGVTHAADTYYWIRARVLNQSGSTFYVAMKLWQDGSAEPEAWTISGSNSDAEIYAGTGGVGLRTRTASGHTNLPVTYRFRDLSLHSLDGAGISANAVITAGATTVPGSFSADAVIFATQSATLTADAVILQTVSTVLPVGGGGADIVRESFTSGGDGTVQTDHTIAVPTGWGAGDTLVVAFTLNGGSLSASSGDAPNFPSITDSTGQSNPRFYMLIGTYADIGAGPWTLVSSSAVYNGYVATRYSGVDQTTPLDTAPVATNSPLGSATWSMTGLTTATNGAMLAVGMSANSSSSAVLTVDGGEPVTEYEQVWSSGAIKNTMAADGLFATAGPTGTIDGTLTSTGYAWAGVVAALRPATSGPHFIEQATGLDWSVAFASGWTEVASIPASSFVANKTYMIIVSGFLAGDDSSAQFEARLAVGTTPTIPADGTVSYDTSIGTGSVSHTPFQIVTPYTQGGTTEKVAVQARAAAAGTASGDVWITAIRIDDELAADTDYWLDEVTADYTTTSSWAAQASVTFTPNGTDEYMVLGWASYRGGVADGTSNVNLRINDSVAGSLAVITQDGEDVTNDIRGAALMAVVTPSAASHTFSVDAGHAGTATSTVFASRLFVLRLDRFADKATVRNAGTSTALATSPSWTNVATVSKTPASTDDWLVLGYATASHATNTSTRFLWMRQQIDPDGGGLASDPAYGDDSPNQSNWKATDTHSVLFSAYPQLTAGGSRTVNLDAAISNGTGNERIFDRSIVAIPKTLGAAEAGAGITGPTMDAVITEDGGSVPGSFAANAVIAKTQSASLTANAVVAKTQTGSFTANAAIKRTQSGSFTASAVIRKEQSGSFSADAVILASSGTKTFAADAVIAATRTGSFTADATSRKTIAPTFSADSIVRRTISGAPQTFAADAYLAKTISGSFTANAVIKKTQSATFTADALIAKFQAGSLVVDALAKASFTGSFAADAVRKATIAGTCTADAIKGITSGSSFALDAVLRRDDAGSSPVDAVVRGTIAASFPAGAWIAGRFPVDAWLAGRIQVDAFLQAGESGYFVVDAWIAGPYYSSLILDSVVLHTASGSFSVNATIMRSGTSLFGSNAIVLASISSTFAANAVILSTAASSLSAEAIIRSSTMASFSGDAVIMSSASSAIPFDAIILSSASSSLSAAASILRPLQASISSDAIVLKPITTSFGIDAVVRREIASGRTVDAIVQRTSQPSLTTDAIVLGTSSGAFAANAWIASAFHADAWLAGRITVDAFVLAGTAGFLNVDAWIAGPYYSSLALDAVLARPASGSFAIDATILRAGESGFPVDSVHLAGRQSQFTSDAIVLSSSSQTLSANAVISSSSQTFFTASAIILVFPAGSSPVDAVVRESIAGSFTVGAWLSATFPVSAWLAGAIRVDAFLLSGTAGFFNADSWIAGPYYSSLVLDAVLLRAAQPGSLLAGAIVTRPISSQALSDAVILAPRAAAFSSDAVISSTSSAYFSASSTLTASISGASSVDATISASIASSFGTDAVVRWTASGSVSFDAIIHRSFLASLTTDAIVLRSQAGSSPIDACIAGIFQVDAHLVGGIRVDAFLLSGTAGFLNVDAWIAGPYYSSFVLESSVSRSFTSSFSAMALVSGTSSSAFTISALLFSSTVSSLSADAVIAGAGAATMTLDAVVARTMAASTSLEATVLSTGTGSFAADAFVISPTAGAGSLTVDALLLSAQLMDVQVDAVISSASVSSFSADAWIFGSGVGAFVLEAIVFDTRSASIAMSAVVSGTATGLFTVDALLKTVRLASFETQAVIGATRTGGFATESVFLTPRSSALTVDAEIGVSSAAGSFPLDAVSLATGTGATTVSAITSSTGPGTFTVSASVAGATQGAFTLDAAVAGAGVLSFTADAVVASATSGIIRLDASISQRIVQEIYATFSAATIAATDTASTIDADWSAMTIAATMPAAGFVATHRQAFTFDAEIA